MESGPTFVVSPSLSERRGTSCIPTPRRAEDGRIGIAASAAAAAASSMSRQVTEQAVRPNTRTREIRIDTCLIKGTPCVPPLPVAPWFHQRSDVGRLARFRVHTRRLGNSSWRLPPMAIDHLRRRPTDVRPRPARSRPDRLL
ncbi:hypothetical protein NL676_014731 [Syzygium grande]|nr:hypothetical protein NL676_014731 [Syzygium grande]